MFETKRNESKGKKKKKHVKFFFVFFFEFLIGIICHLQNPLLFATPHCLMHPLTSFSLYNASSLYFVTAHQMNK